MCLGVLCVSWGRGRDASWKSWDVSWSLGMCLGVLGCVTVRLRVLGCVLESWDVSWSLGCVCGSGYGCVLEILGCVLESWDVSRSHGVRDRAS